MSGQCTEWEENNFLSVYEKHAHMLMHVVFILKMHAYLDFNLILKDMSLHLLIGIWTFAKD